MKIFFGIIGSIVVCSLIMAFIYTDTFYRSLPGKITDPKNSKFVAENFKYTDYKNTEDLQNALRIMFPVGTPRAKIDQILYRQQPKFTRVQRWGASIEEKSFYPLKTGKQNIVYYLYSPSYGSINIFNVSVFYDSNNNLLEITDHGQPLHNPLFWDKK